MIDVHANISVQFVIVSIATWKTLVQNNEAVIQLGLDGKNNIATRLNYMTFANKIYKQNRERLLFDSNPSLHNQRFTSLCPFVMRRCDVEPVHRCKNLQTTVWYLKQEETAQKRHKSRLKISFASFNSSTCWKENTSFSLYDYTRRELFIRKRVVTITLRWRVSDESHFNGSY